MLTGNAVYRLENGQNHEYRILAGYRESGRDISLDRVAALLFPDKNSETKRLFVDIGSGEGHVLEYIASTIGCDCLGLESDPECVKKAAKRIEEKGLTEKVTLLEVDAEHFEFGSYCESYDEIHVYMFLSSFGYSVMGRSLLNQLPIRSRIVTVANPVGDYWRPLCAWVGSDQYLTLYLSIIASEEMRQSYLSSEPSEKETRWRHPPPGSYFPQQIPESIHTIPHDTSCEDAIHICQQYLSHPIPAPIVPSYVSPSPSHSPSPSLSLPTTSRPQTTTRSPPHLLHCLLTFHCYSNRNNLRTIPSCLYLIFDEQRNQ